MYVSERTNILPHRQKLLGLGKAGKLASDADTIESLGIKERHTFMIIGTPESDIIKDPKHLSNLSRVFFLDPDLA